MDKLKTNLLSISNSLRSLNRKTGPKVRFYNADFIIGGTENATSDFGLKIINIIYNADPSILYGYALKMDDGEIVNNGALSVKSGIKTGRSPCDKRIVKNPDDDGNYIWTGKESPNIEMDEHTYKINRETAICNLNMLMFL